MKKHEGDMPLMRPSIVLLLWAAAGAFFGSTISLWSRPVGRHEQSAGRTREEQQKEIGSDFSPFGSFGFWVDPFRLSTVWVMGASVIGLQLGETTEQVNPFFTLCQILIVTHMLEGATARTFSQPTCHCSGVALKPSLPLGHFLVRSLICSPGATPAASFVASPLRSRSLTRAAPSRRETGGGEAVAFPRRSAPVGMDGTQWDNPKTDRCDAGFVHPR